MKNADSYKLYLAGTDGDALIYSGTETSFVFDDAVPCTEYSFYVVAVASKRGVTAESEPSLVLTVITSVATVEGFAASDVTSNSYTISWDEAENAEFYTLYRLEDGEYIRLMSVTNTSCTLEGLENSRKDFYRVSATYRIGSVMQESELSEVFSATTLPDKVENIKCTPYEDKAVISWDKVKNADCYNVYLYENGKYVLKKTVSTNKYTVTGLKDASKQYVRVRAYIRASLGTQKGSIATYSFYTKAKTVTDITASDITDTSYTLSWKPSSDGVNRYYVYRYDESKGGFVCFKTTSATSLKLTGLEPGETVDYRIIPAIVKNGSVFIKGYSSQTFSFSTKLGKVTKLTAKDLGKTSFTLSWNAVENADYYRVYRYDSVNKKYILLGSPRTASYKISGLDSGKRYYYKVRAIGKDGGNVYYGYYSDLFSVTTKK